MCGLENYATRPASQTAISRDIELLGERSLFFLTTLNRCGNYLETKPSRRPSANQYPAPQTDGSDEIKNERDSPTFHLDSTSISLA